MIVLLGCLGVVIAWTFVSLLFVIRCVGLWGCFWVGWLMLNRYCFILKLFLFVCVAVRFLGLIGFVWYLSVVYVGCLFL